ncbi:protein kinase domain-containing protein [Anabaenopsis elenkinii]|uniref:non-specific serine/threonine protein kinase n=1 Tax=Anabaenopsis elenkinii CCIBt3563 TaxID=2779889 RepID=A0A7S6RF23_9CYAN|nr:protein kinase [Anabaenopsis elenkinii]QOV23666.1 protein kinase [Anabaenopsis elenkinii CCIBt3563]
MNYPDFTPQGYEVIRELGRNREGGRIAWLASQLQTGQQVVIKQFCFAQTGSSWSAYKEHEREIQVLKGLKHPGIPEYLGAFATDDGFCLVQEYKNAQSLAVQRSFDPQEIKHIAVKVLEILVYLQNRIPPVIHRDVKPENILVDDQLNVYLIDFGMSRIGSQEVAASSVFQGTPGFIPPEQLRKPTEGSDLYGLGATLICLLTGKKSTQIQDLTDEDDPYVIHFRNLLPRLSPRFLGWLELMVKPRLKERFADAQTALEGLKPLDVVRVPEVKLSTSVLELTATRIGERLKQPIEVVNTMSETLLEGKWEVAPHPQDPPHTPDSHSWIVVSPREFKKNQINCDVWVDTSKLMEDKFYERQLWLRSNADVEVHSLTVRVKTAPLPIERRSVPYLGLVGSLLSFAGLGYAGYLFVPQIVAGFDAGNEALIAAGIAVGIGAGIAAGIGAMIEPVIGDWIGAGIGAGIGIGIGFGIGAMIEPVIGDWIVAGIGAGIAAVIGIVIGAVIGLVIGAMIEPVIKFGGKKLGLFTAGLGISSGIALALGTLHPYILLALLATGLPFATMLLYPPIQRRKLIAQYRRSEEHLIKP